MAKFDISFTRTSVFEGNYSNDPNDHGGETYCGIARKFFPTWGGWNIIDFHRNIANFPKILATNSQLQIQVRQFYKTNFWDKLRGDEIVNQNIADELYDCAVNMGISRAVTFFQQGLNVLNRNATLYQDISVDGSLGTSTLTAFNIYLSKDAPDLLLKVMKILRGNWYVQIMLKDPTQERFARGWLNRVTFS